MNWKMCIDTTFVLLLVCLYSRYMLLCMRPLLVHLAVLPDDVARIARSLIVRPMLRAAASICELQVYMPDI